jgi:hypothetical protein
MFTAGNGPLTPKNDSISAIRALLKLRRPRANNAEISSARYPSSKHKSQCDLVLLTAESKSATLLSRTRFERYQADSVRADSVGVNCASGSPSSADRPRAADMTCSLATRR